MASVEVIREPAPIKEVVIRLSAKEAQALRTLIGEGTAYGTLQVLGLETLWTGLRDLVSADDAVVFAALAEVEE